MNYGIDIGELQNPESKSPYMKKQRSQAYFSGKNVRDIIVKDHLNIHFIYLSKPVFVSLNANDNFRIPILRDEKVTSLEKPFILAESNNRNYFINKINSKSIAIIQLELFNHLDEEPWWYPIKYPLYIATVSVDIITFPFQIIYWMEHFH